ncbi:PREDICTED: DNA primase large subunit-like isoform X2 [Dinoponera quadriceps]|uniref:DNA primase large subunit n=1 Tax=Dinoponera quadriceps TaxID=609295 RepID=A0A6P3WQX6_DINQU|nr:PREDICTED: DNA primase large subunit-like isoform X2 [Dinoponera quadriceps]
MTSEIQKFLLLIITEFNRLFYIISFIKVYRPKKMTSTTKRQISIQQLPSNFRDMYPHDLQFYQNTPFGEIMLDELQEISETRLKVLTLVERIHLLKLSMPVSKRKAALVRELRKLGLNESARLINNPGCKSHTDMDIYVRRRDHISHVILRSVVAFDVHKKCWFFKQEARLFKWRFSSLDNEGYRHFMQIYNFDFEPISQNEKDKIKEYLQVSSLHISDIDSMQFYKVPFSHVPSLVKKRKVFVKQGIAFIPEKDMGFVFTSYFRKILLSALEGARETRAKLYNDERFTRIFANLENIIHTENTVLVQDEDIQQYVSLERLDELSGTSYPFCMRVLHKALRKNHHLTHGGRVQYGLFLKGIGISLSDAMTLWKSEFTKVMNEAAFEKEHIYQIRFIFGEEGSRRDYQPYPCSKIMESIVAPRDYHGCPFKHMLRDVLEDELVDCGFNKLERSAITTLSRDDQYQAACNKYYEIKHGCFNDSPFKHPNVYFNESVKHHISYYNHDLTSENEDTW